MDSTYQQLVQHIRDEWAEKQAQGQRRMIIALAGPPGSGKSTIAQCLVDEVSKMTASPSIVAIPADGFHLPLATIYAMPNAEEALARRGAPWTFDGDGVVRLLRELRDASSDGRTVLAPTFDHAIKDPVHDSLAIGPEIQVCIVEGNYLLSRDAPWDAIADIADARWLIRVDPNLAVNRIASRHLAAGIEQTMEAAVARAVFNDLPNGEYVMSKSQGRHDLLIDSIEIASK